jgi:hypothetical protein
MIGRSWAIQNPDQVLKVETETEHVGRDIDTIEEYDRPVGDASG